MQQISAIIERETAVTRAALQKQVKYVNERSNVLEANYKQLAAENEALKNRVGRLEGDRAEQGELIKQLLERIKKLEKK